MQDDSISVALRLPRLKILEQQELENRSEVTVVYRWVTGLVPGVGGLPPKSMTEGCGGSKTGG